MTQLTQIELLRQFLEENLREGEAGNGHVKNNQYIHYSTPILERYGNKYILNQSRYSLVTGQLQKRMKSTIAESELLEVKKVPEGYRGRLSDFLETNDKKPSSTVTQ